MTKECRMIEMSRDLFFVIRHFDPVLQNQHAIAVAEKSISFPHRFFVSAQNKFATGKGTHQHEQSRAREMKICQQNINDAKVERWMNENISLAFDRLNISDFALNRFEDSHRCCSDGNNSLCLCDSRGCLRRNQESLRMHLMLR